MSVKLIDNEAFYGYRVRRTVDGKLYQEYLSLKKDGKRMGPTLRKKVEVHAKSRDIELENEQKQAKIARKAERCFHDDGSVKGISFLKKKEKSGNLTPIFQVGIASEIDDKIICTSFSVNAHGLEGAWDKAVVAYAKHKNIKKTTKLYKKIAVAIPKVDLSDVKVAAEKVAKKKAAAKKKSAPKKKIAVKKKSANKVKKTAVKNKPASKVKKTAVKKKVTAKKKTAVKTKSKKTSAKKKAAKKK